MKIAPGTYLFLATGLVAASQSGNIIRLGHAHPVAIAAWRLGIATLLLAPLAGRKLAELRGLGRKDRLLVVLAGVALAAHFFTWIAAVQNTTVANAAIFFSVNPVLVALASSMFFRERIGGRLWLAILAGLGGVVIIGVDDFSLAPAHLAGDAWAVACAILFAAYFLLGKRLRKRISTATYVTAIYGVGAVIGFACMPALGLPLVEYDGTTWLCFGLMALVPTLIGHTSFNHALKGLRASWLSAATLTEPVLAGLVAYFAWGEGITAQVLVGYLLVCGSVLVLALDDPEDLRS